MRPMLGWSCVVMLIAVSSLVTSCSGEIETNRDGSPPVLDRGTTLDVTNDAQPQDTTGAQDTAAPRDSSTGDLPPSYDLSSMGQCAQWSAWTCNEDHPTLLCQATCTTGGTSYQIGCVSTGECVCGVAMGPCGKYSWTNPCDACQAAVVDVCCLK